MELNAFMSKNPVKVELDMLNMALYYRRISKESFDYVVETKTPEADICLKIRTGKTIGEMLRDLSLGGVRLSKDQRKYLEKIEYSTKETIADNPVYQAAVRENDEVMQNCMKLYYRIASNEECEKLEKELNRKILPSLPEEYDHMYAIDLNTVDYKLIIDSGYQIMHRPYFAMRGCTHSKCQINPHTKVCIDAAKKDDEAMDFKAFLDLFEQSGKIL